MRVVSNGIEALRGLEGMPHARGARVITASELVGAAPSRDLLVVPNGSDHVAMYRARNAVRAHLDSGGALFCEDGWFTDWVPGNRWIHDNSHPTGEVRYRVASDEHGIFRGIDLAPFDFHDGISGWWACGFIEPSASAEVVLVDTWNRPVVVVDGRMVLTASAPLISPWLAAPLHDVFQRIRTLTDV